MMQTETHYRGMVVKQSDGAVLADSTVHGRPTVNDLATLLAHAMSRPQEGDAHRPRLIHLRGHHQWRELFPVLAEMDIEVPVQRKLPLIEKAYRAHLRQIRDEQRVGMIKPTADQAKVETLFPAIARYVRGYGSIEIGEQESLGFFEDDRPLARRDIGRAPRIRPPNGRGVLSYNESKESKEQGSRAPERVVWRSKSDPAPPASQWICRCRNHGPSRTRNRGDRRPGPARFHRCTDA
jgi:hypothetical protein